MKVYKFEFSLFGINTYVLVDEATKKCAIIDPGMMDAEEDEVMEGFVERNNLTVTHIINTHLHVDHAIGDKKAAELFKAPIMAHKDDEFLGSRMQQQAQMFGIAERVNDVSITTYLEEGDIIKIGEGELKVIHVPGHSPGGIALYDAADGFVISGDSLFAGSIGRTDLPGGDMPTLIDAVKGKLLTLPPSTIVYPGHGPATTVGLEHARNPYLK
ncbi:MAG: MBL fold metallo-hydrolase [Muribaculaceae bacterium]|nr:MBL fold metallo-hydrolase [Muribaculaceae bacterium]